MVYRLHLPLTAQGGEHDESKNVLSDDGRDLRANRTRPYPPGRLCIGVDGARPSNSYVGKLGSDGCCEVAYLFLQDMD